MPDGPDRHNLRNSRGWLFGAVAVALIVGVVYYFVTSERQPSVVSDDGADLISPEEAERDAVD